MKQPAKHELTNQELYVKAHKRQHHQIAFYRILIFVAFLSLWELSVAF